MALFSSKNVNEVLVTAAAIGLGTVLGTYLAKQFNVGA